MKQNKIKLFVPKYNDFWNGGEHIFNKLHLKKKDDLKMFWTFMVIHKKKTYKKNNSSSLKSVQFEFLTALSSTKVL